MVPLRGPMPRSWKLKGLQHDFMLTSMHNSVAWWKIDTACIKFICVNSVKCELALHSSWHEMTCMHAMIFPYMHGWKRYVMAMWATDAMIEGLSLLFAWFWIVSAVVKLQLAFFWMYWHMEYIELNNACMYMIQHISSKPDREHAFMHSCLHIYCMHAYMFIRHALPGAWVHGALDVRLPYSEGRVPPCMHVSLFKMNKLYHVRPWLQLWGPYLVMHAQS